MFGMASAIGAATKRIVPERQAGTPSQQGPRMRAPAPPRGRMQPMAYMADGGLVGSAARTCGCVGPSGGTGGTRGAQDYRK